MNPHEFSYLESDRQDLRAIVNGDEMEGNLRLYREGFLFRYGYSTLENVFNLYAEMVFTYPQQLRRLAKKYTGVLQKAELMKNFYLRISKDFSLGY